MINELFTVKSLAEKATLVQTGTYKPPANVEDISLSKLDLFKVSLFKMIYPICRCLRSMIEIRTDS
jgi:hypothetical protein